MNIKKTGVLALMCLTAFVAHPRVRTADSSGSSEGCVLENYPFKSVSGKAYGSVDSGIPKRISPMRVSPSGGTIYGALGYYENSTNSDAENGWYEVKTTGEFVKQWAPPEGPLTTGFIRNNELCTYIQQTFSGLLLRAFYATFDLNTGEQKTSTLLSTYMKPLMVVSTAYDPEEDAAYGYSYPISGSGHVFVKIDMKKPTVMPRIIRSMADADDEVCYSLTYSPADKQIYGINKRGEMVKIDRATGNEEIVYKPDTGQKIQNLVTGLVYSPFDQAFIWSAYLADGESYLFKLDPVKKTCTKLAKFNRKEEFNFFVCPDELVDFAGPAAPVIVSNTFAGSPSTTGSYTLKLPEKMYDGSAIAAGTQLNVSAIIDGKEVSVVSGTAGSQVEVKFTDIATGTHKFQFVAKKGENFSIPASEVRFIGKDNPAAPEGIVFTPENISWKAVTTGAHGGYIDPKSIKYEIVVDDNKVGETSATSYKYALQKASVSAHYAKVTAVWNDLKSETSISDKLLFGDPLELDVTFGPKSDKEFELFTVIDKNNDDLTWHTIYDDYEFDDTSFFEYRYNKFKAADDWLILPPINFSDAESYYNISFDAAGSPVLLRDGKDPVERFEVFIGTAPAVDAMTERLFDPTEPPHDKTAYTKYDRNFSVPKAGTYYIGIHAISDPFQFKLRVKDISVKRLLSADVPAQVSDLTVVAGEKGALTAKVNFKMPVATVAGTKYDASKKLTAIVKTTVETKTLTDLAPGAPVDLNIATASGMNEISVSVSCDGFVSKVTRTEIYTGLDIPAFVNDFTAMESEDNGSVRITWKAPDKGMHEGGYVVPTGLKYYIVTVDKDFNYIYTAVGTDKFEYVYKPEINGGLSEAYFSVVAENEAGRLPEKNIPMAMCVLGKPYKLPIADDFSKSGFVYTPVTTWAVDESYLASSWRVMNPSEISSEYSSKTGMSIVGRTSAAGAKGRFSLPKFSTKNVKEPCLSIDAWIDMSTAPVTIYAETYGTGLVKVGSIVMSLQGKGWTPIEIKLPEQFKDKDWVALYFDAQFPTISKYVMIDKYEIYDYSTHGIKDTGDDQSGFVSVVKGGVKILGCAGETVNVSSIDGRMVRLAKLSANDETILLPEGIYIVRAGKHTARVIVR